MVSLSVQNRNKKATLLWGSGWVLLNFVVHCVLIATCWPCRRAKTARYFGLLILNIPCDSALPPNQLVVLKSVKIVEGENNHTEFSMKRFMHMFSCWTSTLGLILFWLPIAAGAPPSTIPRHAITQKPSSTSSIKKAKKVPMSIISP